MNVIRSADLIDKVLYKLMVIQYNTPKQKKTEFNTGSLTQKDLEMNIVMKLWVDYI